MRTSQRVRATVCSAFVLVSFPCLAQQGPSSTAPVLASDSLVIQAARTYIGQHFITRGPRWNNGLTRAGKPAKGWVTGGEWECIDVVPAGSGETQPLLVLRNLQAEQISLPLRLVEDQRFIYPAALVEEKRREYGDEFWWEIMVGRAKRGMTAAMCRQALGEPAKITPLTSLQGGEETWSYSNGVTIRLVNGQVESVKQPPK